MKKVKTLISLLITISILFSLCSCGSESVVKKEIVSPEEATAASVYAVAVPFFVALKMTDRVVAVNTKSNFWTLADENLAAAGTVGRGAVDLEKLATYNPTALVHRSNDPETVEAVKKLGVDVICITVENIDDIKNTLVTLGDYFGVPENADKAVSWIDEKFSYIKSIVDTIPLSERKTALLMGGSLGRVAGADMLQSWMIEQAGGIPVVVEGQNHNWIDIGLERVFEYNPDVIFCTSSTALDYRVEDLLVDTTWSAMKAIKSNDLYQIPTAYDSWDMPGISCVIGTMYMLREMYPDYFSVEDFEDQVDDYYRFMFGRCFDKKLEIDWDSF